MTTLPRFFVEPAPWSITHRGGRVKVQGTFWRGILPYHDVMRVADGSRMAEVVIWETGKRFGLSAEDGEALIRRMGECR